MHPDKNGGTEEAKKRLTALCCLQRCSTLVVYSEGEEHLVSILIAPMSHRIHIVHLRAGSSCPLGSWVEEFRLAAAGGV